MTHSSDNEDRLLPSGFMMDILHKLKELYQQFQGFESNLLKKFKDSTRQKKIAA